MLARRGRGAMGQEGAGAPGKGWGGTAFSNASNFARLYSPIVRCRRLAHISSKTPQKQLNIDACEAGELPPGERGPGGRKTRCHPLT